MGGRRSGRSWPLTGRAEEVAFVQQAHADGSAGVVVAGEAGCGKTRLAGEAAAVIVREPIRTVATEVLHGIPFGALARLVEPVDPGVSPEYLIARGVERVRELGTPAVLVVDDVDHLDPRSMALLHRIAIEHAAFLLVTVRTERPAPSGVVALWKDLGLLRLDLQLLSHTETIRLLEGGLGGPVDGATAQRMWTATHGSPMFLIDMATAAVEEGLLAMRGGVWSMLAAPSLPASLRDLVEERIGHISDRARDALAVLAVTGPMGAGNALAALGGDALEELEAAGLIVETDDSALTITHPLYAETVSGSLTAVTRRSIAARGLELLTGDEPGTVLRRAVLTLDAGRPLDRADAMGAARIAYRAGDGHLAERLCQAAFPDPGALLLVAQIHHERGEHESAESVHRTLDALDLDADQRRQLAGQRAVNLLFGLGDGEGALSTLEAVEDAASPGPAINRAWLLVNMGRMSEADSVLAGVDPDAGGAGLLVCRAWVAAMSGSPLELEASLEALNALPPSPSPPNRFRDFPDLPRALGAIEQGSLTTAEGIIAAGLATSIARGPTFIRAWWLLLQARLMLDRGALDAAVAGFRRAAALQLEMNQPGLVRRNLAGMALAFAMSADGAAQAERTLDEFDDIPVRAKAMFTPLAEQARAWLSFRRGRPADAVARLTDLAGRLDGDGSTALADRAAFDIARLGPPESVGGRWDGGSGIGGARCDYVEGLTKGDPRQLTQAATWFQTHSLYPVAAEAWAEVSHMLARSGDRRASTAAARSAAAAREHCPQVSTPRATMATELVPLTDRERQVIVMAAGGMPSKAIAEGLCISVRTVNNLIQRAYTKLGVSSRSEAADALGISPPG